MQLVTLKKRRDFKRLALTGHKFKFSHFILQYQLKPTSASEDAIYFGVTASKKVGNAVVRNRCKRRMRVLARQLSLGLEKQVIEQGLDFSFVMIARYSLATAPYDVLVSDIEQAVNSLVAKMTAFPNEGEGTCAPS